MNYTKAEMLQYLKKNIPSLHILPVFIVRSENFLKNREEEVKHVMEFSKGELLIVRSSSVLEDTEGYSNAGKFKSVINVLPDQKHIEEAINDVYASYGTEDDEQILIQPMLKNLKGSGVVFTSDIETFAGYYTVNYNVGSDSSAVTGGSSNDLSTFIRYKESRIPIEDKDMRNLLDTCKKIEIFLNNDALDIEFAVTNDGTVYILQVRPIARKNKNFETKKTDLASTLKRIYKKAKKLSQRHPFLLGNTTCFGVMTDWNPAEILGVRPKKLAISLYKELITDSIWAHQRYDYGYRNLTMHPLMISFCGVPYIDTRITFNSFVPQNLNERIAEKLVDYYQNKLAEYPKYHDKVEFEIVYSCYYLGLPQKLKELLCYGFNENEISRIEYSLLDLTNRIINPQEGLYKKDINKIKILESNYETILRSDISLVDKIYWLIEECKMYGTLPFAGVARAGFIAVQFLRSFVETGILTKSDYDLYMNSLDTINKRMNSDLKRYFMGEITFEEFIDKYGHIRPGTYDITSKRYDEAFDEYFDKDSYLTIDNEQSEYVFTENQMVRIQFELEQNGLLVTADELMLFIKEAIEGREYLKFIFTKAVSKILQLIEELGKRADIEKEDMAYLDISVVRHLYSDLYTGDIRTIFEQNIRNNKKQYQNAVQIKLPSILVKPENVYSFYLLNEEPNFITQDRVMSEVIVLDEAKENSPEGKIVFIQAADPGYDFLFSKNIAGLITQFGGANSHMAIRCAELGIPAVIGAGEKNYTEWKKWNKIMIDCLNKSVKRI